MSLDRNLNKILIIDFGSQFTQLIARRIRELGVFSEIISHKKIKNKDIDNFTKGIILSGGPLNVYQLNNNLFDKKYASGIVINARGFGGMDPRYYYPGLPRNYFISLNLSI